MRRVTIRDVAQRAGVSSSTVSRVLNDSASISQGTRQAVREAQAGELAIRRLLEKIEGSAEVTQDILEPELVIRSTCRRI